jgi:hypothetical protein
VTGVAVGTQEMYPDFHVEEFWGDSRTPHAVRIILEVGSYQDGSGVKPAALTAYQDRVTEYLDFVGVNRSRGGPMLGMAIIGNLVFMQWQFHPTMSSNDRRRFPRLPQEWMSIFDPLFVRALDQLHRWCFAAH